MMMMMMMRRVSRISFNWAHAPLTFYYPLLACTVMCALCYSWKWIVVASSANHGGVSMLYVFLFLFSWKRKLGKNSSYDFAGKLIMNFLKMQLLFYVLLIFYSRKLLVAVKAVNLWELDETRIVQTTLMDHLHWKLHPDTPRPSFSSVVWMNSAWGEFFSQTPDPLLI